MTRLAGESELRLLQQPISAAARGEPKVANTFPSDSGRDFVSGEATTSAWRQLGAAGGIDLP